MTDITLVSQIRSAAVAAGWSDSRRVDLPACIPSDYRLSKSVRDVVQQWNGIGFEVEHVLFGFAVRTRVLFDVCSCQESTSMAWLRFYEGIAGSRLLCLGEVSGTPLLISDVGRLLVGVEDGIIELGDTSDVLSTLASHVGGSRLMEGAKREK